jgi:hypothetical protein
MKKEVLVYSGQIYAISKAAELVYKSWTLNRFQTVEKSFQFIEIQFLILY